MRGIFSLLLAVAILGGGAGALADDAGEEAQFAEAPSGLGDGVGACGSDLRLVQSSDEERGEVHFLIEAGPAFELAGVRYQLAVPGEAPYAEGPLGDGVVQASGPRLEPGASVVVKAAPPLSFTLFRDGAPIATNGMCI